jgi:hypothetical protein
LLLRKRTPEATFGELGRLVRAAWRDLPKEERAPYEAKATADATRYAAAVGAAGEDSDGWRSHSPTKPL